MSVESRLAEIYPYAVFVRENCSRSRLRKWCRDNGIEEEDYDIQQAYSKNDFGQMVRNGWNLRLKHDGDRVLCRIMWA